MPAIHFDAVGISKVEQRDAVPILEGLAALNDSALERRVGRRFNYDDTLPYISSPESEPDEEAVLRKVLGVGTSAESINARFAEELDRPLDDEEQYRVARISQGCRNVYGAGRVYTAERRREEKHIRRLFQGEDVAPHVREWLRLKREGELCSIVARHRIRQRWRQLGVWNDGWGIPGRRDGRANDDETLWLWPWQHSGGEGEGEDGKDEVDGDGNSTPLWDWNWPESEDDLTNVEPLQGDTSTSTPPPYPRRQRGDERTWKTTAFLEQSHRGWRVAAKRATLATANRRHPVVRALRLRQGLERGEHNPRPAPHSRLEPGASAAKAEAFVMSRPWFEYDLDLCDERVRHERLPLWALKGLGNGREARLVRDRWRERGDWDEGWEVEPGSYVPGWKWRNESPEPEADAYEMLNDMDMEFTESEADALEAVPPPSPPRARSPLGPINPGPRWEPTAEAPGLFFGLPQYFRETKPGEAPPARRGRRAAAAPGRSQRQRQQQGPRRSARIAAAKAAAEARAGATGGEGGGEEATAGAGAPGARHRRPAAAGHVWAEGRRRPRGQRGPGRPAQSLSDSNSHLAEVVRSGLKDTNQLVELDTP